MSEKLRFGYMCQTDYEHELSEGPTCEIYSSIERLKEERKCVSECGIVKVLVTLVEVTEGGRW